MGERFWGAFTLFFVFFAFYILLPYLISCYKCHKHPSYCGLEIVHACSPLPWIFTAMIFILLLLGRWKYLSLAFVVIGAALGIFQMLFLIPGRLFFTVIVPTYFAAGIILTSIPIIFFIVGGMHRLSGYIIKRERSRATRQLPTPTHEHAPPRPMRPATAQAREQSVLAPPPQPVPAPQAVLKWGGIAFTSDNTVTLCYSISPTSSSMGIVVMIERAKRGFKLIVEDIEYPIESLSERDLLEALRRCSSMKSVSPRYDVYYDLLLQKDALRDVHQKLSSIGRVELGGIKTVIKRRVLRPAFLKRVATYQFVKYMLPSRIPKDLHIIYYGGAFDKAVKILATKRSLERAKMKFLEEFMASPIVKQHTEQVVDLNKVGESAFRGLEVFMRTELYIRYGMGYLIPKPRIILIDDSYAIFAQPDFKSVDNNVIIDLKTYDPSTSSKELRERAELEVKVFQLAYPGAKAILLGFPYGEEYDAPRSLEVPPLQPSEALQLLKMLKKFCAEKGSYQAIDLPKYETICYTMNPEGYEFEVYEFETL